MGLVVVLGSHRWRPRHDVLVGLVWVQSVKPPGINGEAGSQLPVLQVRVCA